MSNFVWSPEKARELRRRGWLLKDIGKRFRKHRETVRRACVGISLDRPRCNVDEARRLRVEGWAIKAIAQKQGVGITVVSRACRGFVCPVRHDWNTPSKSAFEAQRIKSTAIRTANIERAREWRERGYTLSAIAKVLGVTTETVCGYVKDVSRGQLTRGEIPEELAERRNRVPHVAVPAWAKNAGLGFDYRDLALAFGEHYAARECRRLKAEAARPC